MTSLANTPSSIVRLLGQVFSRYGTVFKNIYPLLLLSAVLHLAYQGAGAGGRHWANVALSIVVALLNWYLYAAILYQAYTALTAPSAQMKDVLAYVNRRYIYVLGVNIILAIAAVLLFSLGFWLYHHGEGTVAAWLRVIFNLVLLFLFVLFYFTLPSVILEQRGVWGGLVRSVRLVWGNWWRSFLVLLPALLLIVVFLLIGILWMGGVPAAWRLVYSFFAQVISYPLAIAATLVVFNDLQLRANRSS